MAAGTEIASLYATIGADAGPFQKALDGIKSALGGVAGLVGGISFAALFGGAIQQAADAETHMAQLNAVLKSTGGVAGVTADYAIKLSKAFQETTRYSDEAVMGAESVLLTFTNLSKDVFPDALQIVLDMSTALGSDLQSSAIMVGKALQDPINGAAQLRRVGVNVSDELMRTIKNLVATGQSAKATALLMKELQTEFGGSAEAAGVTFAGRLDQLKNAFGDLLEMVGGIFLPGLTAVALGIGNVLRGIISGVQGFANVISSGIANINLDQVFGNFFKNIRPIIFNILRSLGMDSSGALIISGEITKFFGTVGTAIGKAVDDLFATQTSPFDPKKMGHMTGMEGGPSNISIPFIDRIKKALGDLAPIVQPAIEKLGEIAGTGERLAKIGEILFFDTLKNAYGTLSQLGTLTKIVVLDQLSQIDPGQFGMIAGGIAITVGALALFNLISGVQGVISGIATSLGALSAVSLWPVALVLAVIAAVTLAATTNFLGFGDTVKGIGTVLRNAWAAFQQLMAIVTSPWSGSPWIHALLAALSPILAVVEGIKAAMSWIQSHQGKIEEDAEGIKAAVAGAKADKTNSTTAAPTKDTGGLIEAGKAYRVGVPELIIPGSSGMAIPLSKMGGGGGGDTINITLVANGVSDAHALVDMIDDELERRNKAKIGRRN